MTLSELAIKKRVTTVMVISGLMFLGFIAISRLPQELYPKVTFPQLTIVTGYPNAAPEEIESHVTRPIEEAVGTVTGLKKINAISSEGRSVVTISFDWGINLDFAALGVREKIDLVKEKLPREAEDPVVLKFDPLARPAMILSVSGPLAPVDLKHVAEKTMKDNLEKVLGVAAVGISGGLDREIMVEIDQGRLLAQDISLLTVVEGLENANMSYPAGSIKKGLFEYLIRTIGEFQSVAEIGYSVAGVDDADPRKRMADVFVERDEFGPRGTLEGLRTEGNKERGRRRLILLNEISEIKDTFKKKTSISRYNGRENISLAIQKQAGANTIEVVDRVRKELIVLAEELDSRNVKLEIIYDESIFIRRALSGVLNAGLQGAVLAFIVLLIFLRDWRASLVVTAAIPVTVVSVFFLMYASGISINTMSLGGLALGIGMLIDNGIVVIENICRLRKEEGLGNYEAAVQGTGEVMWAMFSSMLTTCAVFMPLLVFVPGVAGQLFKDLSWTVIYSQVISWFISLTMTPLLAFSLNVGQVKEKDAGETKVSKWTNFINSMEHKLLAMDHRRQNKVFLSVIGFAVFLSFIGVMILGKMDREVLPAVDQGQFLVNINMPVGTKLEVTADIAGLVEDVILEAEDVLNTAVSVGSSEGDGADGGVKSLRAHQAQILVNLETERKHSSAEVLAKIEGEIGNYNLAEAELEFMLQESEFQSMGTGKPISVDVQGYDLDKLQEYMQAVVRIAKSIPGIYAVQNDLAKPIPETRVQVDRKKAALYGVSVRDIALTVKTAIDGAIATKYKEGGKEYDVRVQLREADRNDIERLGSLLIRSPVLDGEVALREVSTITKGEGPSEIKRKDRFRTINISAAIEESANKNQVLSSLMKGLVERFPEVPEGYSIGLSGESIEVKEAFSKIMFALVLATLLIYMIMASQFESLMQPFIIMFSVPLTVIGVSIAMFLTHTSLNAITMLGFILLGGIVVNNGIVLIDYVNQSRKQGEDILRSAILSSKVRARPIFMTAITTIVGLIPLAIGLGGEGAAIQAPMAVAVMGGLASSTLLTLLVIPSIYILIERWFQHILKKYLGTADDRELDEEDLT